VTRRRARQLGGFKFVRHIFDDVTRDLVERNLQLRERLARDTEFGSDPFQAIAEVDELWHIVADDDFCCSSGGLWHAPDNSV
jgi:hypothetical protein